MERVTMVGYKGRLRVFRGDGEGISAISLMISLIVAAIVIGVILVLVSNMNVASIDNIEYTVTAGSNAEWNSNTKTLYQVSGASSAHATISVTVYDTENVGVDNAALTITGPGFSKKTASTDKFGKATIEVEFDLPSTAGDFITIKASGGDSGLGGEKTLQIPVNVK